MRWRVAEAAKYIPLEQLALSAQCGFSSRLEGNLISADDQLRKVDRMLETAAKIWG